MQITKEKLDDIEGELRNSVAGDVFALKELEDIILESSMNEIVNGCVGGWVQGVDLIVETLNKIGLGKEDVEKAKTDSLKLVVRHVLAMGIKAGIALSEAEQLQNMMGGQ